VLPDGMRPADERQPDKKSGESRRFALHRFAFSLLRFWRLFVAILPNDEHPQPLRCRHHRRRHVGPRGRHPPGAFRPRSVHLPNAHNAPGGLNSFYSIAGRQYDVRPSRRHQLRAARRQGHAARENLRQLRIDRAEFALCEQKQSRIASVRAAPRRCVSPTTRVFENEIAAKFPAQIDGFRRLVRRSLPTDDVSLDAAPVSAREIVGRHLTDPLLIDMLFCPLNVLRTAPANATWSSGQFAIMFKALFLRRFRPLPGR